MLAYGHHMPLFPLDCCFTDFVICSLNFERLSKKDRVLVSDLDIALSGFMEIDFVSFIALALGQKAYWLSESLGHMPQTAVHSCKNLRG